VTDTSGEVRFEFQHPELLRRYRFALRTGDYLLCRECGCFIAAVVLTGQGGRAAVNINTLRAPPQGLRPGKLVMPEVDSVDGRRARRARSWTPVVGPV
jgi:hypothetical protein